MDIATHLVTAFVASTITWLICANNSRRAIALRDSAEKKLKDEIQELRNRH